MHGAESRLNNGSVGWRRSYGITSCGIFLICSPPLLVGIYLGMYLYRAAWIAPITFLLLSGAVIGLSLLAVVAHTRRLRPSVRSAARLVDEKTEAEDRFLTLATIDVALGLPPWWGVYAARLRRSWSGLIFAMSFPIASSGPFTGRSDFSPRGHPVSSLDAAHGVNSSPGSGLREAWRAHGENGPKAASVNLGP